MKDAPGLTRNSTTAAMSSGVPIRPVPDRSIIMAGTLIGTLPVLVVFVLLGRQIVSGIMEGGVKG